MNREPWFLDIVQVEELHEASLEAYGGTSGCRDRGMVESSLGAAQNTYFYGQGDLFDGILRTDACTIPKRGER